MNRWAWGVGVVVAVLSGLTALGLLMLPLLLLLLMVLFDSATHGLLALLGLVASWLQALLPAGDGGSLPAYDAIALDPLPVAARAALRSAPCLLGLVLILVSPRPGARWWWITLLWIAAAAGSGGTVAIVLLPGLLATFVLAVRSGTPRRRRAAGGLNATGRRSGRAPPPRHPGPAAGILPAAPAPAAPPAPTGAGPAPATTGGAAPAEAGSAPAPRR